MNKNPFDYIPTDGQGGKYTVCFENNIEELKSIFNSKKIVANSPIYIVDKNLPKNFVGIVESITGYKAENIIFIDPSQKTIDRIMEMWEKMVNTVPDIGIIIGGGTVSDLAGFACANYQRGVPRILFPTTVLSMVDASLGGKSGIDFANVKNSIGAIHYPLITINYMPFLKDLDPQEYNAGFAEIIKAAVLYDKIFFEKVYAYSNTKNRKDADTLKIFLTSSRIKARVCEQENKKKISLLYGHSVGHAVERYESAHLRHGDCVAIGMTIEGAMACVLKIWKKEEWQRQQEIIKRFKLPVELPSYINLNDLAKKMTLYKKLVDKENYLFSLPKSVGQINNQETTYLTSVRRNDLVSLLQETLLWIDKANK